MNIEAMKQALEALEQDVRMADGWTTAGEHKAITSLRQAIADLEKQEPVVWMYQDKSTHEVLFQKHMKSFVDHGQTYETPLYASPPQRQPLTDEIPQGVLFAINKAGLTLLKTQHGYELRNIGPAIAHGIKGEA